MTDTPTPQMTPEQRAELVARCRYSARSTHDDAAADQLEADGDTIRTITAERDALQSDLTAADAQIELLLKNNNGMTAEIARLTAALATAREDGFEWDSKGRIRWAKADRPKGAAT